MKKRFGGVVLFLLVLACPAFADKEWAFLVFLNAHNNLVEYGDININQLETVGSTDEVDFIVQWAKLGEEKTHRLRVLRDNDEKLVTSPYIESFPRADMGDYRNLEEFVRWSIARFPAKHYFVAVWNHGSGWHRRKAPPTRGISYDDYSGNHITTEQLGIAMREISQSLGRKIDIIGADACLMAMTEIGAEVSPWAQYLVASQELEPGLGWPYHRLAAWWVANPTATAAEVGRILVSEYVKWLENESGITLSVANLDEMGAFMAALKDYSGRLMSLSNAAFIRATSRFPDVLRFSTRDYADFGNFLSRLRAGEQMGDLESIYRNLIVASQTSADMKDATGLSFWLPDSTTVFQQYEEAYRTLTFGRESGWTDVLRRYVALHAGKPQDPLRALVALR